MDLCRRDDSFNRWAGFAAAILLTISLTSCAAPRSRMCTTLIAEPGHAAETVQVSFLGVGGVIESRQGTLDLGGTEATVQEPPRRRCPASWTRLIATVYQVDPLVCPRCGQRMSIFAFVSDQHSTGRLLDHLGLRAPEQDRPPPAREILRVTEQGEGWGVPASWDQLRVAPTTASASRNPMPNEVPNPVTPLGSAVADRRGARPPGAASLLLPAPGAPGWRWPLKEPPMVPG